MSTKKDSQSPPLTMQEMWQAWPNPRQPTGLLKQDQLEQLLSNLSLDIIQGVPTGQRQSYDPASPRALAAQNALRVTKLAIYKYIINFYHQETDGKQFLRRWDELHAPAVVGTSLEMRLKRAIEGKDSANKKYTSEDKWFGAMYVYALAWGCLMPYYPETLSASDPIRLEMGKFEGAIWSNIAAVAFTGSSANNVEAAQKPGLIQLGLRAALVCMTMSDFVTVGVMSKACNRALKLRDLLKNEQHQTTDEEADGWKRQAEVLNGLDLKMMFNKVEAGKKIVRPRYGDLAAI